MRSRITWNTLRPLHTITPWAWAALGLVILTTESPSHAQEPPAEEPPAAEPSAPSPADPKPAEPSPAEPSPAEPSPAAAGGAAPAAEPATAPAEPAQPPPVDAPLDAPSPVGTAPTPGTAPSTIGASPLALPPLAPADAPSPIAALPPPPPPEDDLPIPTLTIDRIPPNTSYEFAIQVSYGTVAYFREDVPPWVGFGVRGGWGKNFGVHRLGVAGTLAAEGDVGVHTQLSLEPAAAWDIVARPGFLLGASVGPAVVWTAENSTIEGQYSFELAPSLAARIGWSQTWSRVGRRLFVFAEPKVRFARGKASPVVAVAIGSGGGR